MYPEKKITPALQELEAALSQTRPLPSGLDRDRLMFNAGKAAARSHRPWQACSGILVVLLLCSLFIRPDTQKTPGAPSYVSPPVSYSPMKESMSDDGTTSSDYLKLRQDVLRYGLDVLPSHLTVRQDSGVFIDRNQLLKDLLSS